MAEREDEAEDPPDPDEVPTVSRSVAREERAEEARETE